MSALVVGVLNRWKKKALKDSEQEGKEAARKKLDMMCMYDPNLKKLKLRIKSTSEDEEADDCESLGGYIDGHIDGYKIRKKSSEK